MGIDDKIKTLRALRAETDAKAMQTSAIELGLLGEIEEELRTLRASVAMQQVRTMSEQEFADWLGVSKKSVARERMDHPERVKPIMVRGCSARYSTWHQVHAQEIFAAVVETKRKGRKRAQDSGLRTQDLTEARAA